MAATVAVLAARVLRRLGVAAVAAADRTPVPIGSNKPLADIGRLALERLGVVAADEGSQPADAARATDIAGSLMLGLAAQGLISWGGDGTVPQAVSEDLVMLTALHLAPSFGKSADPSGIEVVERRIRRVSLLAGAVPIAAQAIMDVHTGLSARGIARWTVFDIPDYAEGPYVELAAVRAAPQFMPAFEVTMDPQAEARATRELVQAIALPSSGETLRPEYF